MKNILYFKDGVDFTFSCMLLVFSVLMVVACVKLAMMPMDCSKTEHQVTEQKDGDTIPFIVPVYD